MEAHREVIAAKSLFEAGDHASVVRDLQRLVTDEKFISALVVSADPDSTVAPTPTTAKSNKDIGDMFSLIDMLRIVRSSSYRPDGFLFEDASNLCLGVIISDAESYENQGGDCGE
jgi:hypothetical protein